MRGSTLPAGPRAPAAVQILNWMYRPIEFLDACRDRFGDTFSIRFPGFQTPMVIISRPEHVATLFKEREHGLPPGRSLALEPILGSRSILLLEGPEHLARRKLMLPPFHGERMRAYERTIGEQAAERIERIALGRPEALLSHMQELTFAVIMRCVFGLEDERRERELGGALRSMLTWVTDMRRGLALAFLGPERLMGMRGFRRRLEVVDRELFAEIEHRRAAEDLGEREEGVAEATITETLRLRPPVPVVLRRLREPATIAGYDLPAGTTLAPSMLLVHRRADLYPDPWRFDPARFLGRRPVPAEWFPFGGSVRRCLGAAFARFEARVVLEQLSAALRLYPDRERPERVGRRGPILVPARGARVVAERR
jgi:cytochrome P450